MKPLLFPLHTNPAALGQVVYDAFKTGEREIERRDAFTDLCCDLAREGFEKLDRIAEKWLAADAQREEVLSLAMASICGDEDDERETKARMTDAFVNDCADQYEDDARIRMQEMADEDAEARALEASDAPL